jgi:hypothetical protein
MVISKELVAAILEAVLALVAAIERVISLVHAQVGT